MMTMPFGKFKGQTLVNLPDDYDRWLASIELRDPLKTAVAQEAARRAAALIQAAAFSPEWAFAIVSAGVKALVVKHHPDAGGKHEDMAAINATADWLRATITTEAS